MDQVSRAVQLPTHDMTDLSTLRSWVNFPWGRSRWSMRFTRLQTLSVVMLRVGSLRPEKRIPEAILKDAKELAILTIVKVGMMVTYNVRTGLVVARREDGWVLVSSLCHLFVWCWLASSGRRRVDRLHSCIENKQCCGELL